MAAEKFLARRKRSDRLCLFITAIACTAAGAGAVSFDLVRLLPALREPPLAAGEWGRLGLLGPRETVRRGAGKPLAVRGELAAVAILDDKVLFGSRTIEKTLAPLAVSERGAFFAGSTLDGDVRMVSSSGAAHVFDLPFSEVRDLSFSGEKLYVVSPEPGAGDVVFEISLESAAPKRLAALPEKSRCFLLGGGGAIFVSNGSIELWDLAQQKRIEALKSVSGAQKQRVDYAARSPDGRCVAIAGAGLKKKNGWLSLFCAGDKELKLELEAPPLDLAASNGSAVILLEGDRLQRVSWNGGPAEQRASLEKTAALAIDPASETLIAAGALGIVHTPAGDLQPDPRFGHATSLAGLTLGRSIAATSALEKVFIWDLQSARVRAEYPLPDAARVALSSDERWLAVEILEKEIQLYSLETGKLVWRDKLRKKASLEDFTFGSDGNYLLTLEGEEVLLRRSADGKIQARAKVDRPRSDAHMNGHKNLIPIGPTSLIAAVTGPFQVYNLLDGKVSPVIAPIEPSLIVAAAPDGSALLMWREAGGRLFRPGKAPIDLAAPQGFTPNWIFVRQEIVAAVGWDRVVSWSLNGKIQVDKTIERHATALPAITIDGRLLGTVGNFHDLPIDPPITLGNQAVARLWSLFSAGATSSSAPR